MLVFQRVDSNISPGPEESATASGDPEDVPGVAAAAEAAAGRTRASVAARGGARGTVRGSLFQGNLELMSRW